MNFSNVSVLTTLRNRPQALFMGLSGVVALIAGLLIARLPLIWVSIGLLAVILITLTLIDPLWGVGITLFLGPTKPLTDYFVPQLPLDLGQIALILTLGSWFLHAVRKQQLQIPLTPLNVPLFVFLGAVGLSLIDALSLGAALKEVIKWGQMLLIMWLVIEEAGPRRWRWIIGFVLSAAAIEALIGIWQFGLRGDGPEHFLILGERFYRAYGTFEQPNPYAGFLGLTLPLAIGLALGALSPWVKSAWERSIATRPIKLRRIIAGITNKHLPALLGYGLLSGVILAALLMSWSRGAWLGFGAAALIILLAWPRKAWMGALLVIGGGMLGFAMLELNLLPTAIASRLTGFTSFLQTFDVRGVDINDANFAVLERLAHWQTAQEMLRYNFWFGVGIGNYEAIYPAYALMNWSQALGHAHNIYLNMLAEVGIVGLAAYLALWVSVFWYTWQVTRTATGWPRAVALGMLGTWVHLSAHQFVDKLYVANIHLHLGALLGVLGILMTMNGNPQNPYRNRIFKIRRTSLERDN